jgi:acetyltransferase
MLAAVSLLLPALTVRPIAAADREPLHDAFLRLSDASRHRRFLAPKPRLTAAELRYLTEVDHRSHEALLALAPDGRIVAVARYAPHGPAGLAELAVTVEDKLQGRGIGTMLSFRLLAAAAANGIHTLTASMLAGNEAARALCARLGFRMLGVHNGVIDAELQVRW